MKVAQVPVVNGGKLETGFSVSASTSASEAPLRVAVVHISDEGGGAERAVLTVHRALPELGHHSRLYVGSKLTNDPGVHQVPQNRPIPGVLRVTRWLEGQRGWKNLDTPLFRRLDRLIAFATGGLTDVVQDAATFHRRFSLVITEASNEAIGASALATANDG